MEQSQPAPDLSASRGWPFFVLGFALFILGPVLYAIQFNRGHMATPWYVPILATMGVLLMAIAVLQRGGMLRTFGAIFFVLVCAFEWFMIVYVARLPEYTGPAQRGVHVPAFAAVQAEGQPFTSSDLERGDTTILLFFRGHW